MKKFLWILLAVIVSGLLIKKCINDNVKVKAEEEAKEEVIRVKTSEITNMVEVWDADYDWVKKLSHGEKIRIGNILTVDLEAVWLQDRPILFHGLITDISTYNEDLYVVTMKRGFGGKVYFTQEFKLLLLVEKAKIDQIRNSHPDIIEDFMVSNNIASIVSISSIDSETILNSDGDKEDIKIGKGRLLDLVYYVQKTVKLTT